MHGLHREPVVAWKHQAAPQCCSKGNDIQQGDSLEHRDFLEDCGHEGPVCATAITGSPFREARDKLLEDFTRRYLSEALARNHGNISAAARDSGLERQHFQKLMKKCGLNPDSFRVGGTEELQCNSELHHRYVE